MTARSLLAVAIGAIAIWYLCSCATMKLSLASGPFATLIVGIVLLFVAKSVYGNAEQSPAIRDEYMLRP